MRAILCRQLGNPTSKDSSALRLVTNHPQPSPVLQCAPSFVRIQVQAASINFPDTLIVQGLYQERPKLPFIPGSEVSGTVTEVGRDVKTLKVGDKVCAVITTGAFAEEVVAREGAVLKLPEGCDLEAAAGLPVAFGTSHLALCERAQLRAGQTVLVLGAAGGVGVAAVQIAKAVGAQVVAVARGQTKARFLKELGADVVIDTAALKDDQLRARIKAAAPAGLDVVLDPVGGVHFAEALKCVKWGAQVLLIGFASGTIPKIAANVALVKNLTLHGVFWGSYMAHNPRVLRRSLEELVGWLGEGKINIPVSHRYSFEQAAEGFGAIMSRKALGKVLLLPSPPARL